MLMPVTGEQLHAWLDSQPQTVQRWIDSHRFKAAAHTYCVIPGNNGSIDRVLYGVAETPDLWALSDATTKLPAGDYLLACDWDDTQRHQAMLGWGLGAYKFSRYKQEKKADVRLLLKDVSDALKAELSAMIRVRDLINTPPNDMMPPELAAEARLLADRYSAEYSQIVGDALLDENYPAIHAVGRASVHEPRLVELTWGDEEHPRIALVGKGVCFDSGGLDLKSAAGMRYMQKDMGGAAHVLGLAELIMAANLPVHLHVLVPAVENAVAGNAFHPGDILESRSGKTIEIDNTDAEGRLVLCDGIAEACQHEPELLIDFATLTGAARVAVGTEISCYFTNQDTLANDLNQAAAAISDPVWRLPLHQPYFEMIKSEPADIVNSGSGPFGGAITAALFLEYFVSPKTDWIHFDIMAWNQRNRPGRPKGGEAMGIRAAFEMIKSRYPCETTE
jgi:leucyl aminopeptidase